MVGDCLELLRGLPAESVHCVVTSPPYYGLRDYGVAGQIGLEESPGEFIRKLVEVFREVRRVLRKDGTCWVNMGDSYCGAPGGGQGAGGQMVGRSVAAARDVAKGACEASNKGARAMFKPKDLMGMPWRLALALQDDGWWLRQDIIWAKPNPMPESVHDRCCKAHEYVFLLSKSARYFYDAEAVKDPVSGTANARGKGVNPKVAGWMDGPGSHKAIDHAQGERSPKGNTRPKQNESFSSAVRELVSQRHLRSVWTITTEACAEAHFATFPRALVRPCVLAGTSARGACSSCGAPWERIVELGEADLEHQRACGGDAEGEYHGKATKDFAGAMAEDASAVKARILAGMRERKTVGWRPRCTCEGAGEPVPCVVLDPFFGTGTTGVVALEEGRDAVGLELNPEYAAIARRRTGKVEPVLRLA